MRGAFIPILVAGPVHEDGWIALLVLLLAQEVDRFGAVIVARGARPLGLRA